LVSIANCGINFLDRHPSFFAFKSQAKHLFFCAVVLTNASISSFSNLQRQNNDYCTLANCGGVKFEALIGEFTIVNCERKKKFVSKVRNEFSLPIS
jgi:hypothetical protein